MNVRSISVAILAAMLGTILVAVPAQAYSYGPDEVFATYDGIEYVAFTESPEQGAWVLNGGAMGGDVVIPPAVDIDGVSYSVVLIADSAFDSQGVDSVVLPDTLQGIGDYAFRYNHLTSVDFPDSVTSIGVGAFSENSLTSVTLPAHLDSVEPWAFALNAISTLHLNQELVSIGSSAFQNNHLTSVTFPASVEAIHGSAFRYTPLVSITFEGDAPSLDGAETFGTSDPLLNFYHDAQGFTTPTWTGGYTEYRTQMIDPVFVTFDANGHGTAPGTATVRPDWPMSDPGALSETGYTFTGWSTQASGGTLLSFPYTVTGDTTLFARWTPVTYAVTIDAQNGDSAEVVALAHDSLVNPVDPAFTGHTFTGWWNAPTGGSHYVLPITVTGSFGMYAHWTPNEYTVTFAPSNGDADTTVTADFGTTVDEPGTPSRAHYTFTGWFTAALGGTEVAFPYLVQDDSTLYAQWEIDTHTITLQLNDGSTPTTQTADYGSMLTTPTAPTRIGHTFSGWFTTPFAGAQFVFPYTVTGDFTLQAQWAVNEYTLTFEPNNGDAATTVNGDYDTTVGAPTTPTRASFAFTGWFTDAHGGTQVTFPYTLTGDETLYAQWTALPATITAPATATAGGTATITGENFTPGETVEIWLLSTPTQLTSFVVGATGTFSVTVSIPASIPSGAHHLEVRGSTTATMSSPVTVTAVLATTGADVAGTIALAALLTLAGVALTVRNRRTRQAR